MSLSDNRIGLAIVRGRSMLPTYREGDRVVVLYGASPRPGRVHLVQLPGDRPLSIKRVERHTSHGWWVRSDNSDEGTDSRTLGAIPPTGMKARVLLRLPRRWWPWHPRRSRRG